MSHSEGRKKGGRGPGEKTPDAVNQNVCCLECINDPWIRRRMDFIPIWIDIKDPFYLPWQRIPFFL
jgi:hypothetical protein